MKGVQLLIDGNNLASFYSKKRDPATETLDFFLNVSVYLWSVKDAFDLLQAGDVPGVLGERAQRKSVIPPKR